MAFQEANHAAQVVTDLLMIDFRNESPMLDDLLSGEASAMVLAQSRAMGPAGGFAHSLTIPLLEQAALNPTDADGYTAISAFTSGTNPDLSSAYAIPADTSISFDVNRYTIGTHLIPDFTKWTHAAGDLLGDAKVQSDLNQMRNSMEDQAHADMDGKTVYASVAGGVGTKFTLRTGSETNFNADMASLGGEMNRQNVPKASRRLVVHSSKETIPVKYDSAASSDFGSPGSRINGDFPRYGGFPIIYSNNLSATEGVAYSTAAYALVVPQGIVREDLRDKDRIGDFTRLYAMFGLGPIKQQVTAADGNLTSNGTKQHSGIVSLTVS